MIPERVSYIEQAAGINGVKLSTEALKAAGMQPELAAHLLIQNKSMGISIILRAGSPPVYNQKRGPKTGLNQSKTSNQGLFKSSIAAEQVFTRLNFETGKGVGHHEYDARNLTLSPTDPDYQHTVPLPITMQDILRETGESGDLRVCDCENGLLRLVYRENKGDKDFKGQFIVDLNQGSSSPVFYSRPWDRPDHDPNWNKKKQIIEKPAVLCAIPDELYERVFGQLFTVNYSDMQTTDLIGTDIKIAKVFANTPKTSADLLNAIKDSGTLNWVDPETRDAILQMDAYTLRDVILNSLTEDQIRHVYDTCGLATTGDWDGLALGHPPGLPEKFQHVYNTFDKVNYDKEIRNLALDAGNYFDHLTDDPAIQNTSLGNLLSSIPDPGEIFSEFALSRAGCITPHEFLYQQLINHAYSDASNPAYGNQQGRASIQVGLNAGLDVFSQNKQKTFEECLVYALEKYKASVISEGGVSQTMDLLYTEHLIKHLNIAISKGVTSYDVPNLTYDHNVHDLFQHGFEMHNPYKPNLEDAWLMLTDNGGILYGENQEQLVKALLLDDFLEKNVIEISHKVDMSKGWHQVIERQFELGHTVSENTGLQYRSWRINQAKAGADEPIQTETVKLQQKSLKQRLSEFVAPVTNKFISKNNGKP